MKLKEKKKKKKFQKELRDDNESFFFTIEQIQI